MYFMIMCAVKQFDKSWNIDWLQLSFKKRYNYFYNVFSYISMFEKRRIYLTIYLFTCLTVFLILCNSMKYNICFFKKYKRIREAWPGLSSNKQRNLCCRLFLNLLRLGCIPLTYNKVSIV